MSLGDLTRDSVLVVLSEYDEVGDLVFLERHGFDSGEYFLVHDGKRYASTAVAGVAHRYATGVPLPTASFSGGADTVRPALERLGFEVIRVARRNPPWARAEIVLACDLVFDNGWHELRTHDPKVQELSGLLRAMSVHPVTERLDNFRSPDSVSRKTTDLATAHPDYPGARTRGGRLDRQVVLEFISDPARVKAEAAALRESLLTAPAPSRRSGVADGLTAAYVDDAVREWWALSRDTFLARYGGRPAGRYVIATEYGDIDALALLLGARALAGLDTTGPWRGDRDNVAQPLRELGFDVRRTFPTLPPEVDEAEQAVREAAQRSRAVSGRGQGFILDQRSKIAIETHAMDLARDHYAELGTVVDTASRRSWDYEVTIEDTCWHVEVKGTTGDLGEVLLTPNEVAHARTYPFVSLFVVSNITVDVDEYGQHKAAAGRTTVFHPWNIDNGQLRPIGYKYLVPDQHANSHASLGQ